MKDNKPIVEIRELFSKLLGKRINYCVILPQNYEPDDNHNFPVLYLLHGLFGRFDNWLTNTKIIEYVQNISFVIVCADGGDNWYSDTPNLKNHFYESYIFEELIPHVEKNFDVSAEKNSRAIAGISMGGYGAFKLAFRHPEIFCFAGSLSGAFHAAEVFDDSANENWKEIHASILNVFGNNFNDIRATNNLLNMAKNFPSDKISNLPFFYFNCGLNDSFLSVNQRLAEIFRQREIIFNFQVLEGGHDWIYWNQHLKYMIDLLVADFGF